MRRLRTVAGLAAVTSLAVAVIAFVNSSWFDVDRIEVSGNERVTVSDIVEASGLEVGQGLLEIDPAGAGRSVERVPWVATATVTRRWTGAVAIEVTERSPAVAIPAGDRFVLVDHHGRQLDIVDERPPDSLPIRGIEGSGVPGEPAPDEILSVVALLEAISDETGGRLASLALIDGDIHLELIGGGAANLGDGADLGPKLQAFETVLARVDLTCVAVIDVRVPSAPVVTRTAELPPPGAEETPGMGITQEPYSGTVDC